MNFEVRGSGYGLFQATDSLSGIFVTQIEPASAVIMVESWACDDPVCRSNGETRTVYLYSAYG